MLRRFTAGVLRPSSCCTVSKGHIAADAGGLRLPRRHQMAMSWLSSTFQILNCSLCGCAGAVGIYVPGGTAVLPSSALMLSVPAGLAGCKTIVLATPPRQDGSVSPVVQFES